MPEELLHDPQFALRLYLGAAIWLLILAAIGLTISVVRRPPRR